MNQRIAKEAVVAFLQSEKGTQAKVHRLLTLLSGRDGRDLYTQFFTNFMQKRQRAVINHIYLLVISKMHKVQRGLFILSYSTTELARCNIKFLLK